VAPKRRSRWRDTAVLIEGNAAVDVSHAFERMWTRQTPGVRPLRRMWRWGHLRRQGAGTHLDPVKDPPALVGIIEGEPLRLRVERALQMQCMAAQRTVWIATAYFAPSLYTIEALTGAARDGVDVRILLPSRYDHPWVGWLARRYYKRLLRHGVRLWEWRGEMMHAKTSVIDGRWVRVGSTDFNPLGIAINYELDAVIEDPELGRQAEEMFLADLDRSEEVKVERKE
jgi:cardiolipin synthase